MIEIIKTREEMRKREIVNLLQEEMRKIERKIEKRIKKRVQKIESEGDGILKKKKMEKGVKNQIGMRLKPPKNLHLEEKIVGIKRPKILPRLKLQNQVR